MTAERVDHQLRDYMQSKRITGYMEIGTADDGRYQPESVDDFGDSLGAAYGVYHGCDMDRGLC